jgi:hypothetical protein
MLRKIDSSGILPPIVGFKLRILLKNRSFLPLKNDRRLYNGLVN